MFLKRRRWRPQCGSEEDGELPSCSRRLGSLSCRERASPGARPTTWTMSRPTCLRDWAAVARHSGGSSTSSRHRPWRSRRKKRAPAATSRLRGSTPRPFDCLMCAAELKRLDQTGYGLSARRDGCTYRAHPRGRSTMRTSGRAACRRPARLLDAWPPEAVLHPDPQTKEVGQTARTVLRFETTPNFGDPESAVAFAFGTHLGQGAQAVSVSGLLQARLARNGRFGLPARGSAALACVQGREARGRSPDGGLACREVGNRARLDRRSRTGAGQAQERGG